MRWALWEERNNRERAPVDMLHIWVEWKGKEVQAPSQLRSDLRGKEGGLLHVQKRRFFIAELIGSVPFVLLVKLHNYFHYCNACRRIIIVAIIACAMWLHFESENTLEGTCFRTEYKFQLKIQITILIYSGLKNQPNPKTNNVQIPKKYPHVITNLKSVTFETIFPDHNCPQGFQALDGNIKGRGFTNMNKILSSLRFCFHKLFY